MLHSPIIFRSSRASGAHDAATPHGYIAARRRAAGLDVAQVAELIATRADDQAEVRALIRMLETPGARARDRSAIELLGRAFPIDADVYHQLATEPRHRRPGLRLGCGCSRADICCHVGGE